jgi:hypothetical protein
LAIAAQDAINYGFIWFPKLEDSLEDVANVEWIC